MLDIATTSSMTNSMKVAAWSSMPIGLIRMKVHAMPKNRSSRMKRMRQRAQMRGRGGSSRNWRQVRMMTRWMTSAPAVHTPQTSAPVHRPDSAPMVTISSRMTGDAEMRFCANWRSNS